MSATSVSTSSALVVVFAFVAIAFLLLWWIVFRQGNLFSSLSILANRDPTVNKRKLALVYWTSPPFFLCLWGIVSCLGWGADRWFPTPDKFATAVWQLISSGTLVTEAWISLQRVLVGFSGAAIVGVSIGFLAGSFLLGRQIVLPINSFLRYIPPTAFIALLIVYFGVGETYKYAVVFFGVVFFITQMVVDIVDDIDIRHIEMALTSGFSTRDIFMRVIVPSCAPRVLDVLRINLGASWTFLVAAELIGAERGLGHLIAVSQRFVRLGDLFVGIFAFGVIGLASDRLLEWVGRKWFRWHSLSLKKSES